MATYIDPALLAKMSLNSTTHGNSVTTTDPKDVEKSSDIDKEPAILINVQFCFLCENLEKKTLATMICKTEKVYLCDECGKRHRKQRATREHFVISLQENNFQEYTCELCEMEGETKDGYGYCEDCEDSEVMCEMCCIQHTALPNFNDHQISTDIQALYSEREHIENEKKQRNLSKVHIEVPSRPYISNVTSESATLTWTAINKEGDYYQIRYRDTRGDSKYKYHETENNMNTVKIQGLQSKTSYVFQLRCIRDCEEGEYSLWSEEITTLESPTINLLKTATRLDHRTPSKYHLRVFEDKGARNESKRTKKVFLGHVPRWAAIEKEKTIMLVGATGSGKSTLVDGIVNYVTSVNFGDPFRFTLLQLEKDEMKNNNQALSQTEWITVYKIAPYAGSKLNYTLNIIDTPGFGDTRGIERDKEIREQIRHLFSDEGGQGVLFLDAVCFIVKAPDARLTPVQRYIIDSIMSIFGKDIESNICTLITFADGMEPPVLACLKEASITFGSWFLFNNSGLFAENQNISKSSLSPMFWKMGKKSFDSFFTSLEKFESRSISLTKDVLEERKHLQTVLENIHPQINAGLSKLNELKSEIEVLEEHKSEIQKNKKFKYKVKEIKQIKVDIPQGRHVTNCLQCSITCHSNCVFADDRDKMRCVAMDSLGFCKVCSQHCKWDFHKNARYVIKYVEEEVTRTYKEKKEKYEKALGERLTHESYLKKLAEDVTNLFYQVKVMMDEMYECKNTLKKIALKAEQFSPIEHIDLMIEAEERQKQTGYKDRIKMLHTYREYAETGKKFTQLALGWHETTEKLSRTTSDNASDKKQGAFRKFFTFLHMK